nr:MAG TPA: hypothetical protein [Caudoviricetes sp.]
MLYIYRVKYSYVLYKEYMVQNYSELGYGINFYDNIHFISVLSC